MIRTQRWSLDTCDCIYDQQFDDADYEGTMVFTNHVRVCAVHAGIPLAADRPLHAREQNRRIGRVHGRLQEAFKADLYDQLADGSLVLKSGVTVTMLWSGTGATRVLTVTILPALSVAKRAAAQAWADTNIGVGKVVVV